MVFGLRSIPVILLAGLLALAGCDSAEERVISHHERGVALLEEGSAEKAALEFRNALRIDANFLPSRMAYAKLLLAEGSIRGALEHFQKVVELDPAHAEARLELAKIYMLAGYFEEALSHAEAAHHAGPNNAEVLLARATAHYQLEHVEQAIEDANKVLVLQPGNPDAELLLATAAVDAGKSAEAMRMVDGFLAENPTHMPLNLMKLRLLHAGNDDQAVGAHLEKMVERFPESAAMQKLLASWYLSERRFDEAESSLREAQTLQPDDLSTTRDLARFLLQTKGEDAARAELRSQVEAAGERGVDRFPYQEMLVDMNVTLGKRALAEAVLEEIIADSPDQAEANQARVRLARMLMRDQNVERAEGLINDVLENDSSNARALGIRAAIRAERGDVEPAVLDLRAALNETPDDLELLRIAVAVYQRSGNSELAEESLSKAVRISNGEPDLVLSYVSFLRSSGRSDAIQSVLTDAVANRPDSPELLTALASVYLEQERWVAAEEIIDKLRTTNPEIADRLQAASFAGQGQTDEAIALLEHIGASGDGSFSLASAIVQVYVQSGQNEAAQQFIDDLLEQNPEDSEGLRLNGMLLQAAGRTDDAISSVRAAIDSDPNSATAYLMLARLHEIAGRPEESESIVTDALKKLPDNPTILLHHSEHLQLKGDYAGAVDALEKLYEVRPDSIIVVNNLASILSEHFADDPEKLDRAGKLVQRLASVERPHVQDTYGWIRYLQGEPQDALRSLVPAAEALSGNPWVRYHVGMAYAALNRAEEAREHLEAALSLAEGTEFPVAPKIREELDRLGDPSESESGSE